MRISTKGHYAVQALVDIAAQKEMKPVSLSVVAQRQNISQNYLEQLFVKLRKASLVRSVRGPGGGYVIARSPSTITIGEVFEAVDENIALTECVDITGDHQVHCETSSDDKTQQLWGRLCHHLNELIYSITITDVVQGDLEIPRVTGVRTRTTFNL